MRLFALALFVAYSTYLFAEDNLASKIVRLSLNQNEPAVVKLGTRGITTLEFPSKIEAIDGYGFSVNPVPDGPDLWPVAVWCG
jgi:multisubunit Na+/H+ antiporter MnhC subunit